MDRIFEYDVFEIVNAEAYRKLGEDSREIQRLQRGYF